MRSYLDEVDFPMIQRRFEAFWRREILDRPLIYIAAPRDEQKQPDFPVPDSVEGRWLDIEYQINRNELNMENQLFLGEAIPSFLANLGPDSFTAFLGADLRFMDEHTSWVQPSVEDLTEWDPALDRQNRWWRCMTELLDAACEAARGRYLVKIPDMHGGADALAAARHPDGLATDLYDSPGEVRRLMRRMTEIWKEIFDAYFEKTFPVNQGSTTWLPAYSRGRYGALQNDFSGLSSPRMFEEFFLPDIKELAEYLDHSLYHLDGPIALGNLPHLLDIEALDGIQWVAGAGAKPMSQWLDVCRPVQDAGKCLCIACRPDEVEFILSQLRPEGLLLVTRCGSEAEARAVLRTAESAL